jgi:hypothetical protein
MTVLYLASFVGGLLFAVRVMLFGVERPREEHPDGERSFRWSPPVIVAFSVVFGASGYVLTRANATNTGIRLAIALLLGVIGAAVSAQLVKTWWAVTPEHEDDDERYVLQGLIARVTKEIRAGVDGEVTFDSKTERRVVRARSLDDGALAAGAEVVIERIEGDVAYVEAWAEVEKRL